MIKAFSKSHLARIPGILITRAKLPVYLVKLSFILHDTEMTNPLFSVGENNGLNSKHCTLDAFSMKVENKNTFSLPPVNIKSLTKN